MKRRYSPVQRLAWSFGFLPAHVPSFTAVGYELRRQFWRRDARDFAGQTWLVTGATIQSA